MWLWIALWPAFCLVIVGAAILLVVGEAMRMGRGRRVPFLRAAEAVLKPGLLLWRRRGPFPIVAISWAAWTIAGVAVIIVANQAFRR